MSENLHPIDKIFKDAIDEHEERPSADVWNALDQEIDKTKIKNITRKYYWLKRAALFLILISLSITLYDLQMEFPEKRFIKPGEKDMNKEVQKNKVLPGETNRFKKDNISEKVAGKGKTKRIENTVTVKDPFTIKSENQPGVNAFYDKKKDLKSIPIKKNEKNFININTSSYKVHDSQVNTPPLAQTKTNPWRIVSIDMKKLLSAKKRTMAIVEKTNGRKEKNRKTSPFAAIIFFSPDFPFHRLQNDPPDNQLGSAIRDAEKPDLSTTTGIWIAYKLNDHWSFQSGVSYSNTIILIDPKTIYAERDNTGSVKYRYNASSGYGYVLPSFAGSPNIGDSLYAFTSTHTLRYLNIPVMAKYDRQKGKFNFFVSAGISPGILLQGIIETLVENNSNDESEVMNHLHGLKKIYFSGLASIGAEYKLSNKFSLAAAPTWKFALNPINKNGPVKSYPNSFGIAAGVRMNF